MSTIIEQLGETLWCPSSQQSVKPQDVLTDKLILLLFSASWCGPWYVLKVDIQIVDWREMILTFVFISDTADASVLFSRSITRMQATIVTLKWYS
jgi:hypothetical protein